ncbi:MAG: hypothetical protein R3231_05975 [bacterium]|nr:hypothetical protein [bacterium]
MNRPGREEEAPRKLYLTITAFVLVASFVLNGCAHRWAHPDFETRSTSVNRIAVVPVDVEVYKLNFSGDHEVLYDQVEQAMACGEACLDRALVRKGYEVVRLDTSPGVLDAKPHLKDALFKVRAEFQKALQDMQKRRSEAFEYRVGPEINVVADAAKADVVLLYDIEAFKKSAGQISKDVAKSILIGAATLGNVIPIYATKVTRLQVAIVDGDSGDVLWYNNNFAGNFSFDVSHEKTLERTVVGMLSKYPEHHARVAGNEGTDSAPDDSSEPEDESTVIAPESETGK